MLIALVMAQILGLSLQSGGSIGFLEADGNFWDLDNGNISLMAAQVDGVEAKAFDDFNHRLKLVPLAVFAGRFDPTAADAVVARLLFAADRPAGSVLRMPREGEVILVMLQRLGDNDYVVVTDLCPFMPQNQALVKIESLSDPVIQQVVQTIREARREK